MDAGPLQPDSEHPVWLFDGVCAFCDWSVRFLLRHERQPDCLFVAIQSETGQALALRHGVNPDDPATFLFIENGRALTKSDGVIALARHLRWPWRLLGLWRLLPKGLRDWQYGLIARNRYRLFGRKQECAVPYQAARARFILP